VSLPSDIGGQG